MNQTQVGIFAKLLEAAIDVLQPIPQDEIDECEQYKRLQIAIKSAEELGLNGKRTKCALCGMTISRVTYGRFGPKPIVMWKHVGNRFQQTKCKTPTP